MSNYTQSDLAFKVGNALGLSPRRQMEAPMSNKEVKWSPQQAAFIDWCARGRGSVVVEAVAGSGKSTTLIKGAEVIPGQVAMMAYNKAIADELNEKLKAAGLDWKKAQAGTAHSFGFSAYRKVVPHCRVDENKVRNLTDLLIPPGGELPGGGWAPPHELAPYSKIVVQLVSLAKQSAIGIMTPMQDRATWERMAEHFDVFEDDETDGPMPAALKLSIIRAARDVLIRSNSVMDLIDFDDMIYMPLFHRMRFWQYDVVMVDEAQDTNAARRALVRAMLRRGGRVIAVGDRHQAIYGFTGADADSLDLIAQDHNCSQMPLTVSYRCPQRVVAFAQQWVSHIQAAPTAPEGAVTEVKVGEFLKRNDLDSTAAVLCRNTKPLVELAFQLIRQRTPCRVEGSDVAARIKKLATRWKVKTLDALENKLSAFLEKETTKLLAKKQETRLAATEDLVETVRVIIDQCRREKKLTVADVVEYVDDLFREDLRGVLTLSTIHRSKGREWKRVFWLDRAGTCPSKWARQQWQQDQEVNLMYVAATRAKEELVEVLPDEEEK